MSTTAIATSTNTATTTTTKPNNKMKVNIYRNFQNGQCAEAFDFYKSIFGGEFTWKAEWSMAPKGTLANVEQDGTKIMHMGLALTDGVELMGADDVPMKDGQSVHLPPTVIDHDKDDKDNDDDDDDQHSPDDNDSKRIRRMIPPSSVTNNVRLSICPESKEHADQLHAALSADGGVVQMPMGDQFWGSYFGMCMDRFGTQWMFDYTAPTAAATDVVTKGETEKNEE
jgi:PhnB protein